VLKVSDENDIEDVTEQDDAGLTDADSTTNSNSVSDPSTTIAELSKLQVMYRYYVDAKQFIEELHSAIPVVAQLLNSQNKSEVIESIAFFEAAHLYRIEKSTVSSHIRCTNHRKIYVFLYCRWVFERCCT
jgi:hypothetical protein